MIALCPVCNSEDVTNLSDDSNDFICNDCGEDFKADNEIDLDSGDASFIDIDPQTVLFLAKKLKGDGDINE